MHPDFEPARNGFLRGTNHVDDVSMRDTIAAWIEGDHLIEELTAAAGRVRQKFAQQGQLIA